GWSSSAPAGRVLPPLVTSRSCLPLPPASKSRSGPSSAEAARAAGEGAGAAETGPPPVEAHGDHLLQVGLVDQLLARLQREAGRPAHLLKLAGPLLGRWRD